MHSEITHEAESRSIVGTEQPSVAGLVGLASPRQLRDDPAWIALRPEQTLKERGSRLNVSFAPRK